jgi:RNA ligase (TIGR02306 family)
MRKLASIQTIAALDPIPGADAIELARVLGWAVVVKRGEFSVGDSVIYCEIDSLLPERREFEFLRTSSYKPARIDAAGQVTTPAGFRIKTVRLRGQVSQGICFGLSLLPEADSLPVGTDVTEPLEIVKWEPPISPGMVGRIKGPFPDSLPKTDETRVQLLANALIRHQGKEFYVTEKLDGSSYSAFHCQGNFGICSRNQWIDESDTSSKYVSIAQAFSLPEKLAQAAARLGHDIAIQGEMIGPGIQGNKYGLSFVTLRVFNVLNLSTRRLLDFQAMQQEIKALGLESVPYLETIKLDHTVDDLIVKAEGKSVLNSKTEREGIAPCGRIRFRSRRSLEFQGHQSDLPPEIRRMMPFVAIA